MKFPAAFLTLALLAGSTPALLSAAEPAKSIEAETSAIVDRFNAKIGQGKSTEEDFAPELKAFDDLLAAHKGEKTDEVSEVLLTKASFYLQVLGDMDKALPLVRALKTDFPDTKLGHEADGLLASLERQAEAQQRDRNLIGTQFADFAEKDTTGQPLSVARFKGKVVLLDFWATWCQPCVQEMPNVIATYQKYHDQGFEIIGVSLDDEGGAELLAKFTKQNQMPWPQFFDGQYWNNKLAVQYGISAIPHSYLIDGAGKIIGVNLDGAELPAAVAKAVGAK